MATAISMRCRCYNTDNPTPSRGKWWQSEDEDDDFGFLANFGRIFCPILSQLILWHLFFRNVTATASMMFLLVSHRLIDSAMCQIEDHIPFKWGGHQHCHLSQREEKWWEQKPTCMSWSIPVGVPKQLSFQISLQALLLLSSSRTGHWFELPVAASKSSLIVRGGDFVSKYHKDDANTKSCSYR